MRDSVRLVVPLRSHSHGGVVGHANRRIERRVQEALALRCACELDARRLALMVEEGTVVVDRRRRGRVKEVRGDGTAIRRGGLRRVLAKERRPEAARLVVLRLIAREAELDGRRLWKVEHVDHVHVRRRRGVEGQVRREAADRVPPAANKRLKAVGRTLHRRDLRAEVADDRRREAHAEGEDLAVDIEAGERGNEGGDLRGEGRSGREVDGDEAEDRRGEVRAEGDLADRRLRTERMRVCTQPRVPLLVSTVPPWC